MARNKKPALGKTVAEVFAKPPKSQKPQRHQIPSVLLQALRSWDKNRFVQLKRKAYYECLTLKGRWGFFVILLTLADYKTGILKISSKDLTLITGFSRKSVYKILTYLNDLEYINYTPAKNQYHKKTDSNLLKITILNYKKYVRIGREESSLAVPSAGEESSPAVPSAGEESSPAVPGKNRVTSLLSSTCDAPQKAPRLSTIDIKIIRQDDDEKIARLFKEKTNQKIPSDTVKKLLQKSNQDVILKHIKKLDWDPQIENPIGLLIDSLENPQNYPSLEKESQEEIEERERLQKEKEEKERQEELKRLEEERKKSEKLERRFNQLPKKKRDYYIKTAEEELRKESPNLTEETLQEIILRPHNIKIRAIEVMKREEEIKI